MQIVLPQQLHHVGDIGGDDVTRDPRHSSFFQEDVEIDMRPCKFIWPAGLLWCLTYPLVALRRSGRVLVRLPNDPEVLHWLSSLGLPSILREAGVVVHPEEQSGAAQHYQVVMPLRCFRTSNDAENVATAVVDSLARSGLGTANVRALVGPIFSELALNAVQHAES